MAMEDYCITEELEQISSDSQLLEGEALERMRMKMALCIGNREALEHVLGHDGDAFIDFYPDMRVPTPTTDDTISDFLTHFGYDDEKETDMLTRMIFTPPQANAAVLSEEIAERAPVEDATTQGIDSFLSAHGEPTHTERVEISEPKEELPPLKKGISLTESLARVMIRKGNYSKALEIITQLSLSGSEKSIYFADQIRFLKKLIKNQQKINNK